jgi:uncharacterized membrane protein YccC
MRIMGWARRGPLHSARPSPLARGPVAFVPEAASLSEGLRAAAACASLAAVAVILHRNQYAWAAVMAFWTCLVDPGGPTRTRARALGLFAAGATSIALISSAMAGLGLVPAALTLLVLAMICSYLRVYGPEVATLSNLLVVCAVVTVTRPADTPRALIGFGVLCLGGCLWAALLSLTVWRIHPYKAARAALGAVYRRLAAMAMALAATVGSPGHDEAWTELAQHHRRLVRQSLEEARRLTAQAVGGRGGQEGAGEAGERLFAAIGVAETEFLYLVALSDQLERAGPGGADDERRTVRLIKQVASLFHRLGRFIEAVDGEPQPLRLAIARLNRGARTVPPPVHRLVVELAEEAEPFILGEMSAVPRRAPASGTAPLLGRLTRPLRAGLNWKSQHLRHAARVAVSVFAAFLLTEAFKIPYGYWMTTTVVLVLQPYLSNTWVRALERVLGGVLGGAFAALLGLVFHSELALLALIFPLAIAAMAFRAVNYSLYVFFLTPLFVLILDLTHPGTRETAIAGLRALNTVGGGLIALAGSLLLWPGSEGDRLRGDLADAIERNGRLADFALGPAGEDEPALRSARREAGLASSRADDSRRRAALELWRRRDELEAAAETLAAVRRLGGASMTLWLHGRSGEDGHPDAALGAWCAAAARALAEALRAHRPPALDPAPDATTAEAQTLVEQVEELCSAARPLIR